MDKVESAIDIVMQKNEAELRPSIKPTAKMKGFFGQFAELDKREVELKKLLADVQTKIAGLVNEREEVAKAFMPMLEDVEDRMIVWKEYKAKIEEIAASVSSRPSYAPAWKELMLSLSAKLQKEAAELIEKHKKDVPGRREFQVTMDPTKKPLAFRAPNLPSESVKMGEGVIDTVVSWYRRLSDAWWGQMDELANEVDMAYDEAV